MVLLIARHVVGMRHAPGRVHFSRALVDKLRPRLMDGVAVFPKLLPLQPATVFGRGADQLGAPLGVADVVLDVPLRDLRVRGSRRPRRVRVDVRRADATGLGRRYMRQDHADSGSKNREMDACSHRLIGKTDEDIFEAAQDAMCIALTRLPRRPPFRRRRMAKVARLQGLR
jgi:hypothetical protein